MEHTLTSRIVTGRSALIVVATVASALTALGATPSDSWPQWGGAGGDFKMSVTGLADAWPADGPRRLWKRPLGEGFAAVVADAEKVYTMYRQGDDEVVVALRAGDGKTAWEHRYLAAPYDGQTADYGQGPNASPLLVGDRVITVGFTGVMNCLKADSGEPVWSHDLVKDFSGEVQYYGYSNSPIAYKNTIITLVGGDRHGVIALDVGDGEPVWKSEPRGVSYAAPVLINVDGQDQVVFFSPKKVIGIDPQTGSFLWDHPVINFCRTNCTSVVWGDDNLLWAATKGVGGTRVLKLSQRDGKTTVEEVWLNRKLRVYHWNAVRVGDYVYTSSGDNSMLLSVVDIKTGKIVKKSRGFGSTNGIYADGKLIILDDGGKLALAEVGPKTIDIKSTVQLTDSLTWTPPTLVGTTLYVRDRREIMALGLD